MKRRELLNSALGVGISLCPLEQAFSMQDDWGAEAGYPSGWGAPPRFSKYLNYRVGNFSGGFESLLPTHTLQATQPKSLQYRTDADIRYPWGFSRKSPADYVTAWPITGLLVARKGVVLFEGYGMNRQADMRMTGWSMSKSVTSLLVGICLDQGLIASIDDLAEKYVPELRNTLHGQTTIRNLMNMSSGANILHDRDNDTIYPKALRNPNASVLATVQGWNVRAEPQGVRFNYNELCPLTVGLVVRAVAGKSLSEFAQKNLWEPLGAEGNATWLLDQQGVEFNCIGFAAQLRDWAKLGQLVAQRGAWHGRQIISRDWMNSYSRWTSAEAQVRPGMLEGKANNQGYNRYMWHEKADGSRLVFSGAYGQYVVVDFPSETVLVHTSVTDATKDQKRELGALFQAAIAFT